MCSNSSIIPDIIKSNINTFGSKFISGIKYCILKCGN